MNAVQLVNTPVEAAAVALAQAIVDPGYGLRILTPAPQGLPDDVYTPGDAYRAGYTYSVWYDDCGSEVMLLVDGLGVFTAEYDRSVVPTLPA